MRSPIWLLLLSPGCIQTSFPSEEGQLRFETRDLTAGGLRDITPSSPVLVGTAVCADVCVLDVATGECRTDVPPSACFAPSVAGPGHLDGDGCLVIDDAGDVTWAFDANPCEAGAFVDDRVTLRGIAPADVQGGWELAMDDFVLDAVAAGASGDGEVFLIPEADPATLRAPAGEPLRIAEGPAWVDVVLRDGEGNAVIRGVGGTIEADGATVSSAEDGTGAAITPTGRGGGQLRLRTDQGVFPLGTWESAAPVHDLQLVAAGYTSEGEAGVLGARAVLRDAGGAQVFGGQVAWGVDGPLAVSVGDDRGLAVFDQESCIRPSLREGDFQATVQARYGKLEDAVTVTWTLPPLEASAEELAAADADWVAPETCLSPLPARGCGCQTGAGGGGLAAALAAAAVVRGRGRRRSASR